MFLGRAAIILVARIGESFLRDLRNRLFGHMMSLSLDYFETEKTGPDRRAHDLRHRRAAGADLAGPRAVRAERVPVRRRGRSWSSLLSWQLALGVLVIVPPVYFASRWFRRVSNKAYLEVRDRISTNLSTLQESLEGVRVVQAFGRERAFTSASRRRTKTSTHANMYTTRISAKYFPVIEYAGVVGTAVIIGYGGWLSTEGHRHRRHGRRVRAVPAKPVRADQPAQPALQHRAVGRRRARRRSSACSTRGRPCASARARSTCRGRARSTVDHVTFAYGDNEPVLHDVSLHVADGERIALVGPTGAGKSTLAKLIARFYDPVEGSVKVGDVDLRDATFTCRCATASSSCRRRASCSRGRCATTCASGGPKRPTPRSRTRCARSACSTGSSTFPEGLDTEVRERGSRLSAGERQLVSLARAALADPSILILDEATSNLDPGTERSVEQALERLMHGRTVVVVAHRLSTAARADRIAVVFDGRLAELGTHDELVAHEGHYASLYRAWAAHQATPDVA